MRNVILAIIFVFGVTNIVAQSLQQMVYYDKQQLLNGLITPSNHNKQPAILILPAWKGIDEEAKQAALNLASQGYVAFIADIYGEGNYPKDNQEAAKISAYYKTNYVEYQKRIAAALHVLKQQGIDTQRIVIMGYCFGGTGALEAARANLPVNGVICIHGGLAKAEHRNIQNIIPKIMVQHPAEDKSVSKQDYDQFVNEVSAAKADWQIITYANCGHTFTNPLAADYNPIMADRAWQHTLLFLRELFK